LAETCFSRRETKKLRDRVRQFDTQRRDVARNGAERPWCEEKALGSASTRGEVEKVLAEIVVSGQHARNSEDLFQTIEQIVARGALPK